MKIARLPDGSPEIFHTLQGEGPSLGAPAVFLRLSLCNLHCQWCDTPYTWNFEGTPWFHQDETKFSKSEQIIELTSDQLVPLISQYECPRLVITGGEPLLQQDGLIELLARLPSLDFIEIETNCTQLPDFQLDEMVTQYNVSPKLSNSGMNVEQRIHEKSLRFFARSAKTAFKFVISSETDLEEAVQLEKSFGINRNHIFFMPEGRTANELQKRSELLSKYCIKNGYRYSPRLHVLLWGDKRGR